MEEIVSEIQNKKICGVESLEDECEEENAEKKLSTTKGAHDFLHKTMRFIGTQEDVPDDVFAASRTLERFFAQLSNQKWETKNNTFKRNKILRSLKNLYVNIRFKYIMLLHSLVF